ncbi:uncharacterized protein M421DRAFT_395241, partial [Didymella exigua CBS 183.55]
LPEGWKWDVRFHPHSKVSGSWTCRPLDDNEPPSFPLTITGAPAVLPVDYRWPPKGGVNPPSDPRSSNPIDCRAEISVDIVQDILLTFEGCVGFYLLINGPLQIIVPEEFDTAVSFAYTPHVRRTEGLLHKLDSEAKDFPTRTQSPQTNPPINVRSMLTLSINDAISASGKKQKRRFEGRIGPKVVKDGDPCLVMSFHVITGAISARTLPIKSLDPRLERPKDSWKEQVEIIALGTSSTIEKTYDEAAQFYPDGFPHDIILIKLLGSTASQRDAKTTRCWHDSDTVIAGESILLNMWVTGSKPLRDLDRSVWKRLVSRAVLYRFSLDFDLPTGNSGIALYANGTWEDITHGSGVLGFQSLVQRSKLS